MPSKAAHQVISDTSEEIRKYGLLNNEKDLELTELAEIAAAVCQTPLALISISDEKNLHFVAKKGSDLNSMFLKDSFCTYTLHSDEATFEVDDPLNDSRFCENSFVLGSPHVRFYLGTALKTSTGNKIGTLCVMDKESRTLTQDQKRAFELIAKRVVKYLENRKTLLIQSKQIEFDQQRLRFLTDNVPGAIFQLDYHHDDNRYEFSFTSAGISDLHPALKPRQLKEDPFIMSDLIHPDDRQSFQNSIGAAIRDLQPWMKEFRLVSNEGSHWFRGTAVPKRYKNTTEWYGLFENINYLKEYQLTLEGIAFDISHGLRKPVSNLLGLIDVFEQDKMSKEDNENFKSYVKTVSVELEKFTKQLNETYSKKKVDFQKMMATSKLTQD